MPKPIAGSRAMPRRRLRLAVRLPTAESSTEATVKSAPRAARSPPLACVISVQKIRTTPHSPSSAADDEAPAERRAEEERRRRRRPGAATPSSRRRPARKERSARRGRRRRTTRRRGRCPAAPARRGRRANRRSGTPRQRQRASTASAGEGEAKGDAGLGGKVEQLVSDRVPGRAPDDDADREQLPGLQAMHGAPAARP